jgi:ABC-type transport system substrate-binding protein
MGTGYITFHLREGVKWHNKAPMKGKTVTADDVVYTLERQRTLDTAYLKKSYPDLAAGMTITKVDESTVRIDYPASRAGELLTMIDFMYIYPKAVIEAYGNMNDWERAIGTGAFSLEDYTPGTSLHYEKNPDWWGTYPVIDSPSDGDELPYLDGYNVLIQPDFSTQDSLFMTGQIDIHLCDTNRAQVLKDLPGVEYKTYFETANARVIFMRTDKADKPYGDVRVRQALQLAIDGQKLVDELYGGDGEILYWPIWDTQEVANAYVPLEDLDDDMIEVLPGETISVADLFGYNPDLARELLAEAGYPDGFEAEIDVYNYQFDLDSIQAVVSMLAEIGVDLTITTMDYATWTATWAYRNYNDMFYGSWSGIATYFKGINWSGTGMFNTSYVNDPTLNSYRDQMMAAYPDEDECDQIHAEMMPYLLKQCYAVQTAGALFYVLWWPWVKNYSGEGGIGYYKTINPDRFAYIWLDLDLKESMGY